MDNIQTNYSVRTLTPVGYGCEASLLHPHSSGRPPSPARMLCIVTGILLMTLIAALPASAMEVYGISKPSSYASLGFSVAGRVVSVLVKDGDFVSPGDVLAEQDGGVLDARIAQLRLEAASMVEVDASRAELAQREQDVKKISQAHQKGAATDLELERAELEVVISRFRVQAAQEKREMAALKLAETQEERKQLFLRSSIQGRVENLALTVGEAPRPMEPVLVVVNCDPLWIEVPLPLMQAATLSSDDKVTVRFLDGTIENAGILFIASVADAASETVAVRLALPNPANRRAGERVSIVLPGQGLASAERALPPEL